MAAGVIEANVGGSAPVSGGLVYPLHGRAQGSDGNDLRACRADPEAWYDPARFPQTELVCEQCPMLQWCARQGVKFLGERRYRLHGMWAGVAFEDDLPTTTYRKRVAKLRVVAATGSLPSRRRRRPRKALSDVAVEHGRAVG